jgi:hypothetical protein
LAQHTDLRDALNVLKNPHDMRALVVEMYARENGQAPTNFSLAPSKKQKQGEECVFDEPEAETSENQAVMDSLFA